MTTSIALLRGVNVGGKRSIAMADLRAVFVDAGYDEVRTYIQSGNVVFAHPRRAPTTLRRDLERRIAAAAGLDVPVVLRSASEWAALVHGNPFTSRDLTTVHVAFFAEAPTARALAAIDADAIAPEELVIAGREAYLHFPNGVGRAKLPPVLDRLPTRPTVRNWRTVTKILELATA